MAIKNYQFRFEGITQACIQKLVPGNLTCQPITSPQTKIISVDESYLEDLKHTMCQAGFDYIGEAP